MVSPTYRAQTEKCAVLTNGWACYKTTKSLPPMKLKTLKGLYDLGNKLRSKSILGDRAHAIVMEGAADDWQEQLICNIAPVKAFFGYSKYRQEKLIQLAEDRGEADLSEARDLNKDAGTDTWETPEDRGEAELDKERDLNKADEAELGIALQEAEAGEDVPPDGSE
jgi:hypothetical protein